MTNQEIFELLSRFEKSSIHTMKLLNGSFSLELSKATTAHCGALEVGEVLAYAPVAKEKASSGKESAESVITAPLAGVFYEASSPGENPYVSVGDRVKAGQTVCLLEAMKMISEIPAPCDCIITAIFKENGKLAEFNEPLFRYQPC